MGPTAAPPAAPPPPPPSSGYSDNQSVRSALSEASSYQHGGLPTPINTHASQSSSPFPVITNYGLSPQQQFYGSGANNNNAPIPNHSYQDDPNSPDNDQTTPLRPRGDVHLRPNTGNTNQELEALLPGSLREIASTLRWMTIITTVTAILWEGFAIPGRILMGAPILDPARLVLGAYLGVFCVLLLGVEVRSASPILRDNFGFLYNPMTRGCVLLMMSSMCVSILKSWWESLLGVAFLLVGLGYMYTYAKYPEYRRWQDYNETLHAASWQNVRQYWMRSADGSNGGGNNGPSTSSMWANPDEAWNAVRQTSSEARALLHNV